MLRKALYRMVPPPALIRALYWRRRFLNRLERETLAIKPYVRRGSVALDVGAYDGVYTIQFARWGAGQVHCFEPEPRSAERLRRSRLSRATVHAVALSDRAGVARFTVPSGTYGRAESHISADGPLTVRTQTLDSYGFHDVSFLKIDVEGHELQVLRGGSETIRDSKPAMLVEIEQRHHKEPVGDVVAVVGSLGYSTWFLDVVGDGLRWRSFAEFDARIHQSAPEGRSPGVTDYYINNFLFLPA